MANRNLIPLILIAQIFVSCKINGSFQGLFSYYQQTQKEAPDLLIKPENMDKICQFKKDTIPKVYIANGKNLKGCVENDKKSLIYIWGSNCKSKICYDLRFIQDQCNTKNIELYVVAEYYDAEGMLIDYKLTRPIIGIDTEYYKTNITSKYLQRFKQDLAIQDQYINEHRYQYFENGQFIKSYYDVEDLFGNGLNQFNFKRN